MRLLSRVLPFKKAAEKTSGNTRAQQGSIVGERPPARRRLIPLQQTQRRQLPPLQRARRIHIPSEGLASVQVWWTWTQVQWMPEKEARQHNELWGRRRSTDRDWTGRFWLCQRRWRGSHLRGPAVAMQPKEPCHYIKASNFLLKVFGKAQGVQSHYRQRQLRKYRLYCIGGLFEIRNRATPHPYTSGWIKKGQGN